MKILVAGATGLVGSAIIRNLSIKKANVIGISSRDVNLLDRDSTFLFLEQCSPDVVIDAAAKVGGIGANNLYPVDFLSDNLRIQTNIMDASQHANVTKFIFMGSSCIYPKMAPQPIKESELLNGSLESTNSAYALAKIAGIELIKSYRKQHGRKWISLMPANLYGPGDNFNIDNGHVLPSLLNKFHVAITNNQQSVELWGDGSSFREFLHVDDLAEAVIFCINNYDDDEHLNIGSGEEVSIRNLAEIIASVTQFKGEIRWNESMPNGTPRKILDSSRLNKLGWAASIKLEDGVRNTYNWFVENSTKRI